MTDQNQVVSITEIGNQIDKIVSDCVPVTSQQTHEFNKALVLAQGIHTLREIFLNNPEIKKTIEAMQDTRLGFMTDRSPAQMAAAKAQNKTLNPYSYEEVAECVIDALLNGYRLSGNEFNMIASNFYPAKAGKYRKIIEREGITDFKFTTTSPAHEVSNGQKYAKVRCFASWKKDGIATTVGIPGKDGGAEDTLIFRVKVNNRMGDDAVTGKALSKLFSRVLLRLDGTLLPESSDVDSADIQDAEVLSDSEGLGDRIKEGEKVEQKPAPTILKCRDEDCDFETIGPDEYKEHTISHSVSEIGAGENIEDQKNEQDGLENEQSTAENEQKAENTDSLIDQKNQELLIIQQFIAEFKNMKAGFPTYTFKNLDRLKSAPEQVKEAHRLKWFRLIEMGTFDSASWPLELGISQGLKPEDKNGEAETLPGEERAALIKKIATEFPKDECQTIFLAQNALNIPHSWPPELDGCQALYDKCVELKELQTQY